MDITLVEAEPGRWVMVVDYPETPYPEVWGSEEDQGYQFGYMSIEEALEDLGLE